MRKHSELFLHLILYPFMMTCLQLPSILTLFTEPKCVAIATSRKLSTRGLANITVRLAQVSFSEENDINEYHRVIPAVSSFLYRGSLYPSDSGSGLVS